MYVCMYVCREQSRKVCYLSNNHNGTKRVGSLSCVLVVKNHLLSSLPTTICNHPKRKGLLVGLLSLWSLQFANLKLKNWFDTGPLSYIQLPNWQANNPPPKFDVWIWGSQFKAKLNHPTNNHQNSHKWWMKHHPPPPSLPVSHLHKTHTNQHLN